jgi:AcrR family transcriptional regulator
MAQDRRDQIVQAAFACLADKGFEGLRMRDVAAAAGLNIATVHYWFATKEDLIRGVHQATLTRFAMTLPDQGTPAERLAGYLDGIASLVENDTALRRVLAEIAVRGNRHEEMAAALAATEDRWFATMAGLLREGAAQGQWRAEVEPESAAGLIITTIKGAFMPVTAAARPERLRSAFAQLRQWLIKEDGRARTALRGSAGPNRRWGRTRAACYPSTGRAPRPAGPAANRSY